MSSGDRDRSKRYVAPGQIARGTSRSGSRGRGNSGRSVQSTAAQSHVPESIHTQHIFHGSSASSASSGLRLEFEGMDMHRDDELHSPRTLHRQTEPDIQPESSVAADHRARGELWTYYGFDSADAYQIWLDDRRTHMTIDDSGWIPHGAVRKVKDIFAAGYSEPWPSWSKIPVVVRERWFQDFGKMYKWWPRDEAMIRRLFHQRSSVRLRDFFNYARPSSQFPDGRRLDWLSDSVWEGLCEIWRSESYKARAKKNADNRRSNPSPHYLGSISSGEMKRRMRKDSGEDVTDAMVFERMHRKQTDGFYSDPKAEQTMDRYHSLVDEATSRSQQDPTALPVDHDALFYEAAGGYRRGRVYGLGSQPSYAGGTTHNIPPDRRIFSERDLQEAVYVATADMRACIESQNERMASQAASQAAEMSDIRRQLDMIKELFPRNDPSNQQPPGTQ